jgi:Tfp pilus assembly protein PilO
MSETHWPLINTILLILLWIMQLTLLGMKHMEPEPTGMCDRVKRLEAELPDVYVRKDVLSVQLASITATLEEIKERLGVVEQALVGGDDSYQPERRKLLLSRPPKA